MRGLQFSLKKGQKLRLESALEKLESLSSKANSDASVTVADDISVNYEDAILKYFIYSFINFFMVKKCARNCAYFSLHWWGVKGPWDGGDGRPRCGNAVWSGGAREQARLCTGSEG